MGQRSQIYVRYYKDGKYYLTARYYQWNYGERMISRCRYALEWIKEHVDHGWDWYLTTETEKLKRILDTNFDMKDVVLGCDIIKEWEEYCKDDSWGGCPLNDYIFLSQDNNDGKLFIDIKDGVIKYAFLDWSCNIDKIMTASKYMDWDSKGWRTSEYIDEEQKELCKENLKEIKKLAKLMTKEEIENFINYNYESNNYKLKGDLNMSKWKPNEHEEKLIEVIEEAKKYCNGELELDNFDGEWYALDYRADLEQALSIDKAIYNIPVITDEVAQEYNIDIIKCCDYCDVSYVG